MKFNKLVFVLILIICNAKPTFQLEFKKLQSVNSFLHQESSLQLAAIDHFSECFVFVINFRGLDINYRAITTPIVLLRYFSFPGKFHLYPIELNPYKFNTISEKLLNVLASLNPQRSNSA